MNECFARHRNSLIMQTPAMLHDIGRVLRVKLATAAQVTGFVAEDVILRVKTALLDFEEAQAEMPVDEMRWCSVASFLNWLTTSTA